MISDAQNAANLKSASNLVAAALGVDPGNLTYDQRVQYNAQLAAKILAYPDSFNAATIATANTVQGQVFSGLDDTSINWGDFGSAVTDNVFAAGAQVAGAGEGALTAVSWLSWILPLSLVAVAVLLLLGFKRRVGA